MSSRVRVLNVTRVHPAGATAAAGDHELSFFDAMHINKIPIQRLFFFDSSSLPPFPSVVSTLRSSLADTLAVFSPLAGELAYRPSGTVVLDCSPDAVSSGVKFVEAEYLGGADDMRRLAREDEHDTEAFLQLVPDLDVTQLPARVLSVQVTRPATGHGTVAVGVTILHAVADGQAVWQFMNAWSTASREGSLDGGGAPGGLVPPTFDRAAILQHPMNAELSRMYLGCFAPALPLLRPPSSSSPAPTLDTAQQSRRTFVLTADRIRSLKQHISQGGQPPTTTYVAISSLVWASLIRAKSLDHADDAHFIVMADCRRRLPAPPGEGYFGNCVRPCFARANVGDLCGEGGVARAAVALREGLREVLDREDPLEGMERVLEIFQGIPMERLTSVGSSHRFMAYETDFGWGAPSRVELVSMFKAELVTLLGARERGAVQVSVALGRPLMVAFAANFLALAGSSD